MRNLFNFAVSCPVLFVSQPQITRTLQPILRSFRRTFLSRSAFEVLFVFQKAAFVRGITRPNLQLCMCQKHPCTKTTFCLLTKTMSGLPGRSDRCSLNRKPNRWTRDRTISSGLVSFERIAAIFRLRCSLEWTSDMGYNEIEYYRPFK